MKLFALNILLLTVINIEGFSTPLSGDPVHPDVIHQSYVKELANQNAAYPPGVNPQYYQQQSANQNEDSNVRSANQNEQSNVRTANQHTGYNHHEHSADDWLKGEHIKEEKE